MEILGVLNLVQLELRKLCQGENVVGIQAEANKALVSCYSYANSNEGLFSPGQPFVIKVDGVEGFQI